MLTKWIEDHRELVEVGKEHDEAYDNLIEDDSNWILDEEGLNQPKTADIANKYEALGKVCENQQEAISKSHEMISALASDWEDGGANIKGIDVKFAAFFAEFGV